MAESLKVGQKIPLNLQLSDDDQILFPRVILKDDLGADLPSSPIDLPHIDSGLYLDSSVSFPAIDRVYAIYRVYDDALRTSPSKSHFNTVVDVFDRDFNRELLDQINIDINSLITNALPGQILEGFIDDNGELTGLLLDDQLSLIGEIEDNGELVGEILEEDFLEGFIDSQGQELIGVIEC